MTRQESQLFARTGYAFESREFLRVLVLGKEVTFTSTFSLPTTDNTPRDIGIAQINGINLAEHILAEGWAKVKEGKRDESDADKALKELESRARAAGKAQGVWNSYVRKGRRTVYHTMPADTQQFVSEWKGKTLDALVESVRDGSTVRVRLMLPDVHQIVNLTLAGVRSPRAGGREGEPAEPWGEEAKFFTESRIGQRIVQVQLLALPSPTGIPFQTLASAAPTPASSIIGLVLHPAGNIAEHLVAAGLARIVDWHAGMLSPTGGMEKLRAAERAAKERRSGIYTSLPQNPSTQGATNGSLQLKGKAAFDAEVIRIWSGDQISVVENDTTNEHRLQLSSLRAPKGENAAYTSEAKEVFLRKRLIGENVRVKVDFVRPAEGDYEERECATVHYGGATTNIAEELIKAGLATALRHKRDDENRSSDYDKYMAAEQVAIAESRGMHSAKPITLPRIGNASESAAKATQFLYSFKRAGRLSAQVLNVNAGSRFKLLIPKENQTLTFALAGIRTPRPPRVAFGEKGPEKDKILEKGEPWGQEALNFAIRKFMQRDVEVEFDTADKGEVSLGRSIELVKNGFADVLAHSANALSWSRQLLDAEAQAKAARLNIWLNYEDEESGPAREGDVAPELKYFDVMISDVRHSADFSFSIQRLDSDDIASLERLMQEFSLHHRTASSVPGFTPRRDELISARFSGDGNWYRARTRRVSPATQEAEVTFIQPLFLDDLRAQADAYPSIRPLDDKFRSLPGHFVKIVGPESEYHEEAVNNFQASCAGRKLIANVDYKDGGIPYLRLIDPNDPAAAADPNASINVDLVRDGLATIDRRNKYASLYTSLMAKLREASDVAKRERAGIYEFGDVSPDD
ncbi:transcription factor [Cantharellus anzutake]|uniref:transcription factor n=1 Tax=Cantharellus anzutake TaxID=1750568 RepID=UPI001906A957|nr:transcription factor [Cantharellus anzutake]KAF8332649.1 transcription factor [Cantharellus anzutake]